MIWLISEYYYNVYGPHMWKLQVMKDNVYFHFSAYIILIRIRIKNLTIKEKLKKTCVWTSDKTHVCRRIASHTRIYVNGLIDSKYKVNLIVLILRVPFLPMIYITIVLFSLRQMNLAKKRNLIRHAVSTPFFTSRNGRS